MKLKYCLTGIVLLSLTVFSQQIKPLTIGDAVPDVQIKSIFNYPALQSNLSDFKNKLLILDFMATNCSSCIKALPSFAALQKKYSDKIQILLVTNQSPEKVQAFLSRHTELALPMVAGDSLLSKFFPHTFISHEVWIKDGIVKAITQTEYVNNKNVDVVLANQKINWPVKRDFAETNNMGSLFQNKGNDNSLAPLFYSILTKSIDGTSTIVKDTNNGNIKISLINFSLIELYQRSYNIFRLPPSHIVLETKDKGRFIYNNNMYKEEWKRKNTFCYESVWPLTMTLMERQAKMRSDLDCYFGLQGRMERRKGISYVLVHTDAATESSFAKESFYEKRDIDREDINISISNLIYTLNQNFYSIPSVDSSHEGETMLCLPKDFVNNIEQLQQELKKYHLQLVQRETEAEMLVITDKNILKSNN